ncbi:MAG: hypothetical protein JXB05_21110 [Myxococcaceae bacterium]|nr:hypothetical protein [Myxococcaceae bacterium]
MKDSTRLALSRSALLPLWLLALSCGGGGNNKPLDNPQATLTVPKPNTAGQKLTVQVGATGCEAFQSLSIFDREEFIKTIPYSGGGSVPVDLAYNEIKYTRGIAAHLSLKARVVCSDGRQSDSQPQAATFFPAEEVVELPNGFQVVPDNFVTEGALPEITFLGCGNDPSEGGAPKLYHVNKSGGVLKEARMPFLCTPGTVITPKHPVSGKRWVWTPDGGAIAVNVAAELAITATVNTPLDLLAVGPDGDAIIYDAGGGGLDKEVRRISHENGANKWPQPFYPPGFLITSPAPRGDDVMFASITTNGAPANRANIYVTRVDYGRQNPAVGGATLGTFLMKEVASAGPIATEAPPTAFSPEGGLLYMSFVGQGGITTLLACVTEADGCAGAAMKWTEPAILPQPIVAMVPYRAGTRLAVIAPQHVWFLDTANGSVTNKGGVSLSPEGGLVVHQVHSGGAKNPLAFYLLNGPVAQEGAPAPQPLEIVATDDPANGELYRYQINSGSISAAMDDSGTLWLRVGSALVRPLPPAEYRKVLPVTP